MVNPTSGKIIVTASGVHDPDSSGGSHGNKATLGDMAGLEQIGKNCEMIDGGSFDAQKAYRDSKLCNILFTRELQRRLSVSGSKVSVNCFSPGLILESGFFRHQSIFFKWLFGIAATYIFKITETCEWGGGCLVYMITSVNDEYGKYYCAPSGSSKYGDAAYGNQFRATNVSKEAMDDAQAKRLWELSEKVLGLS
jgi:protochlorophyllide reductase